MTLTAGNLNPSSHMKGGNLTTTLSSLGWQVACERENSDKKTNTEDGSTGPLARNGKSGNNVTTSWRRTRQLNTFYLRFHQIFDADFEASCLTWWKPLSQNLYWTTDDETTEGKLQIKSHIFLLSIHQELHLSTCCGPTVFICEFKKVMKTFVDTF